MKTPTWFLELINAFKYLVSTDPVRKGRPSRRWTYAAIGAAITLLLLSLVLFLGGCESATSNISEANTSITNHAQAATSDIKEAIATNDVGPLALPHLNSATGHMAAIQGDTITVSRNLTKVKDITPWWATLMGNIALIVLVIAVFLGSLYLGLFPVVRAAIAVTFGWLKFLPKSDTTSAKFDIEYLTANPNDGPARERIAARRSSDPTYDAAFRLLKPRK
jgi:hypothetical protein